ncbi:Bifunctional transcriptional activator/DNA repair enzyme Ada [Planctomycetes bacterium Pla163]|uniref:Methylated-DNA--protein-cysteine methyltransferase n=1 Tax=Rohdeia mirabilis TaxID=2528008 RepID=A0A518CVM2_9BACT|nr:Bifunctional transcriptional activator/DNA repair enzyme Ada [Planctomycetes bacterium Pla163]
MRTQLGEPARLPPDDVMYAALVARDAAFEGVFVAAIRTTGIVCRPTCPARKPLARNVEYFGTLGQALAAGYRPCKRCRPLEPVGAVPDWLAELVADVEADAGRRFTDADLRPRELDPARVRRWFLREHGLTFHAFQRARRLGRALGHLTLGADLDAVGEAAGFESASGFRDAFQRHFGAPPGRARGTCAVRVTRLTSPLGPLVAAATDDALVLLEFADRRMLSTQIERLRRHLDAAFAPGDNGVLERTQTQLDAYFAGRLTDFDLPLALPGTPFQRAVWSELRTIPYGTTRSYAQQAAAIGRPEVVRAVGRANGDNRLAIVVPCHRVVGADGRLTGYGGHLWRKQRLLELEAAH